MKHVLLVTLLAAMLAVPSAVSVASPPTPPGDGDPASWGWYPGCIVEVYGTGPWSYHVWFAEVGKFGYYGPTTSLWAPGTGVIAYVSTAGNPMGITTMIPSGWCDPNGEPLGLLDGAIGGSVASVNWDSGKVSGHARERMGPPGVCRGSEPTSGALTLGMLKYDSLRDFSAPYDSVDVFSLAVTSGSTYKVTLTNVPAPLFVVADGYPVMCLGSCFVQFQAQATGTVYISVEDDDPDYFYTCQNYEIKAIKL